MCVLSSLADGSQPGQHVHLQIAPSAIWIGRRSRCCRCVKGAKSKATKGKEDDSDDSDDPDDDDYMQKRADYVTRRIREAKKEGKLDGLMPGGQNPIAAEARRELIKAFFKDINGFKKCVGCSGYVIFLDPDVGFPG